MSPWRLPSHPPAGICCCGDLLPWRLPSCPPAGYPTEMSYISPTLLPFEMDPEASFHPFPLILRLLGRFHLLPPKAFRRLLSRWVVVVFLHIGNALCLCIFGPPVESSFTAPSINFVRGRVRGGSLGSQRALWQLWQSTAGAGFK